MEFQGFLYLEGGLNVSDDKFFIHIHIGMQVWFLLGFWLAIRFSCKCDGSQVFCMLTHSTRPYKEFL